MDGGLRTHNAFQGKSAPHCPLVSIITIALNAEQWIERTIKSVIEQAYPNIEYLVIDGGSSDDTISIIRQYEDHIAYWRSEPDSGISAAFNKGLELATGDIIGLINADDWYEPDTVQKAVAILQDQRVGIVHGMLQYWHADGLESEMFEGNDTLLFKDMTVNHPTVFVRRQIYEQLGGFCEDFFYAMDYEWLLRAKISDVGFFYLPECLANMRLAGISDKNWKYARKEVARAKNIHRPSILNNVFYGWQLVKGTCRLWLERIGLQFFVRQYHRHISYQKKLK